MFRVVVVDTAKDYIEIQSFDGDVDELEIAAWRVRRQRIGPAQTVVDV